MLLGITVERRTLPVKAEIKSKHLMKLKIFAVTCCHTIKTDYFKIAEKEISFS